MKCERCQSDTSVERYEIDGFSGYLCRRCRDAWERLQAADDRTRRAN